jgi:serine/threonine-protein phosphatase 2A activator
MQGWVVKATRLKTIDAWPISSGETSAHLNFGQHQRPGNNPLPQPRTSYLPIALMMARVSPENGRQPPDLSATIPPLLPRRRQSSTAESSEPGPETPRLPPPVVADTVRFQIPTRRILSPKDHELFLASPTYQLVLAFIFGVADSVRGKKISDIDTENLTPTVEIIRSILDDAEQLVKDNPPVDIGSRFGNPSFRAYHSDICTNIPEWHQRLALSPRALLEVSTYFENSFGSIQRIDYGSGHELNFFLWLLCLNRLSILPSESFPSLALVIFPCYLRLMRSLQTTYYLEPAGSHGVWGLDDYQFLPFLIGASQLVGHKYITPKSIHNAPTLEGFSKEYLYLDQVAFVNSVKNVEGLRWHSPMLDDISAAKSWVKIEAGMKKMFVKEVMGKLPVMQHFLFGSLIPAVQGMSVDADHSRNPEEHDHQYDENTWGDCCGIKVPSSLGAAEEMKKQTGSGGLRRLPFD